MKFRRIAALSALSVVAVGCVISPAQQAPPATSSSKNSKPEQRVPKAPAPSGAEAGSVYRNPRFGFAYKVPLGWVERTKEMQGEGADPKKGEVLLAVFERPPEVRGDTVNSAVVIVMESAASYPGLKEAADYLGPLTELTASKGFKAVEEPYEAEVGGRWLARADFSKPLGNLTMRQSSLVMLTKGSIVSFTFIGGSADDVEELIEGLSFATGPKGQKRK